MYLKSWMYQQTNFDRLLFYIYIYVCMGSKHTVLSNILYKEKDKLTLWIYFIYPK